ncbi:hypothetical protein SAMN04487985_10319 [Aerococcus urinaehominis]|nr:hypothetical protein [Aerococcus urinaehominis]SDL95565.1 hypothetical protein SAMN04487985_10319 [Aerococcus urinaehominis]
MNRFLLTFVIIVAMVGLGYLASFLIFHQFVAIMPCLGFIFGMGLAHAKGLINLAGLDS